MELRSFTSFRMTNKGVTAWEARSGVGTILGVECHAPLQYLEIPRFPAHAVDARSPGTEMVTWADQFLRIRASVREDCVAA